MRFGCNQHSNGGDGLPDFFDFIDLYGDQIVAITEDSEQFRYQAFLSIADEIKESIDDRCVVFCICENSIESLAGYVGFLRGKIVPVLISATQCDDVLHNLLNAYLPKYIWVHKNASKIFSNCEQVYDYRNYVLLKTDFNVSYSLDEDLAILLTTSGSTGSPKLVRQSYKNIISNANSIASCLSITADDRSITTMPMNYTYGLSIINSFLLKGASICYTNKTLMDKEFWQLIKLHEVTSLSGVPYIYEMLKKLRFSNMELPSLNTLTQAGGKLSSDLSIEFAKICHDKGIRFFVMYGQTEATARMSYLPSQFAISKAGSIGVAIPGGKFWLENDNGVEINENGIAGDLVYEGDNVTMGYALNHSDLCKGDENRGILKTGDLAKRDDDGFYYITGRKKRFLKIFGNRVNLDEVEDILYTEGFECACTGSDDKMVIFLTPQHNLENAKQCVANKTNINPAGYQLVHIPEIPRNSSGKVMYSALSYSGESFV
jgi:acyl-coenzyme A synthetase/AMP-(fatty) acid ligase